MFSGEDGLDRVVLEIVREHHAAGMRPTREEIAQLVLDYLSSRVIRDVAHSLDRLLVAGLIDLDRDSSRGRPFVYAIAIDNSKAVDCSKEDQS
jgi:hypothetical protein